MPIEPTWPVVVGVDGSAAGMAAVDLAAEEAVARVVPLVVVHAYPGPSPDGAGDGETPDGEHVQQVRRMLEVAVARATSEHPGLAVAAQAVPGDAADVLVVRSRQACLLVVGHQGRRAGRGSPVESVAVRVAGRAEAPVIVHRPLDTTRSVPQPRPLLLGVPDAAGAEPVVEFAFAEAALRGAPLHALLVWPHPSDDAPAGTDAAARHDAQARREAELMLAEALTGWADKYPEVRVSRQLRHGLDVPVALAAASRSTQLVVVGSQRLAGAAPPGPGSVGAALVHRAGCPVAVVPLVHG